MPNTVDMLAHDTPARLSFMGSEAAELFAIELRESMEGVLRKNYHTALEGDNAGFVSASVDGRPWTDTMWTRDAGVFLRELVHYGYFGHACLTADCLMSMVQANEQGFKTFPQHFDLGKPASGHELDGTTAIIIALVLLWQRLPATDPMRECIYEFLHAPSSPLRYVETVMESNPLIPGSGEFGGGCGIEGLFLNVVQNNMVRLALLAAAAMERQAGDSDTAARYSDKAQLLDANIAKHLIGDDGAWIWCIDPETKKPDPAVINHTINKGFGGLNGPACMSSDVTGLELLESGWSGVEACLRTFEKLHDFPLRGDQFAKYGMWTQFDEYLGGYTTGPSYGHGYALQAMLLFDKMDMAERALNYLAEATYRPPRAYPLTRECPYWFYERYHSPDAAGIVEWWEGCGALNLVCVAEPLKIGRMMVGVDDSSPETVTIIPRIPPSWTGFVAENWPIRTPRGLVRADIRYTRKPTGEHFRLEVTSGGPIPSLTIKLGDPGSRQSHFREGVVGVEIG